MFVARAEEAGGTGLASVVANGLLFVETKQQQQQQQQQQQ